MINDLTPAKNVESTNNPQGSQDTPVSSDANSFQSSAGTDVLSQNHPIQVVTTGQPIVGTKAAGTGISAAVIVFIIVSSIILLMVASSVFRYVMKRPEPAKPEKKPEPEQKRPVEVVRPRGKKKLPRSKRQAK